MNAAVGTGTPRPQRADGAARIRFVAASGRTVLGDLFQRAPCRALFPCSEAGDLTQAVLLTTSGGLTGGDRIHVAVEIGEGARATVTTQAAEKVYRALPTDEAVSIQVSFKVGAGGWGEWLGQETILFANARVRRQFEADVAPSGRLLAVESVVFGRTAMGERFEQGLLHDAWRIRRDESLIWADGIHLDGNVARTCAAPFGFGTGVASATVVYVGADANRYVNEVRSVLRNHGGLGTATAFDGLLVVRLLAQDAASLRGAVIAVASGIRNWAAGLPARLPQVWYC
ncbi:MAG: urease accessory protein UreD [Steroidobacteraceae bacterium]